MAASSLSSIFAKERTFRPKKKWEKGTLKYDLHKKAKASLHAGLDLKGAVQLPPDEDLNDWIAIHVVDFFNRVNLMYGTIADFCTDANCPKMSGGPKFEYYWTDGDKYKKPTALTAPKYINLLMDWIDSLINSDAIFPTQMGTPFPKAFLPTCKKILTRLYRVFVHVYIHHFDKIVSIGAEAHINSCYKHFYYFVTEFQLVDPKEFEPLREMTSRMCRM